MTKITNEKHKQPFPSGRAIRRACEKELYRTIKRLKIWVPADRLKQAEELYVKQVMLHLPFIVENGSNRKVLADWWEEHVSPDIAPLWDVEAAALNQAFRSAFGG